jgi:hypothetical protein
MSTSFRSIIDGAMSTPNVRYRIQPSSTLRSLAAREYIQENCCCGPDGDAVSTQHGTACFLTVSVDLLPGLRRVMISPLQVSREFPGWQAISHLRSIDEDPDIDVSLSEDA